MKKLLVILIIGLIGCYGNNSRYKEIKESDSDKIQKGSVINIGDLDKPIFCDTINWHQKYDSLKQSKYPG